MKLLLLVTTLVVVAADAFIAKSSLVKNTNVILKDADIATAADYLESVPMGPPDAILGIAQAFRASEDERKVNVCVGAYRDSNGKPWILPSVREAERRMLEETAGAENKEYLPIEGDTAFINKALEFAYGADNVKNLAGVQTLSGTGACRVGGAFLSKFVPEGSSVYIPAPTWGNHWKIMSEAGLDAKPYRYYSRATNGLDYEGMLEDLKGAPDGSVILLHACAHNPTGCDPSKEQWKEICSLIREKNHIVFFDSAYQGFASGDAEQDAFALRYFVEQGDIPVMLAQSFAKNFGLYGERCGTFSIVCKSEGQREKIMSQLRLIIRPMYSNPPKHGSSIVRTILSDTELTKQYYTECKSMADRINEMRTKFVSTLKEAGSTHDWSHVSNQIGMFAYTGMSKEMCRELTEKYAIYLTMDGRISVAGLNDNNVEYVAKAVHDITDGKSITTAE